MELSKDFNVSDNWDELLKQEEELRAEYDRITQEFHHRLDLIATMKHAIYWNSMK